MLLVETVDQKVHTLVPEEEKLKGFYTHVFVLKKTFWEVLTNTESKTPESSDPIQKITHWNLFSQSRIFFNQKP